MNKFTDWRPIVKSNELNFITLRNRIICRMFRRCVLYARKHVRCVTTGKAVGTHIVHTNHPDNSFLLTETSVSMFVV